MPAGKGKFRLPRGLSLIVVVALFSGCLEKKMPDTQLNPCSPYAGFFKGGERFIDADSVNEDGTLNRYYMFKQREGEHSPCYPAKEVFKTPRRSGQDHLAEPPVPDPEF